MVYGIFQIFCPISWSDPDPLETALEKLLLDLVKHEFNQNNKIVFMLKPGLFTYTKHYICFL